MNVLIQQRSGPRARAGVGNAPLMHLYLLQLPVLVLLVAVVVAAVVADVPMSAFTRDPAAISGINPFNGLLAQLGNILWSATVAVLFFSGFLLRRRGAANAPVGFCFYFGSLTALLLLDDMFLLHERVLPGALAVPEVLVYAFYGALLAIGVWRWQRLLRTGAPLLFGLACGFFALSIVVDVFGEGLPGMYLVEDGAKLLGIFNWCASLVALAAGALGQECQWVETSTRGRT